MTHELSNHEYIANGLFIVRTQAGFKQVLTMYQDGNKMEVEGFPVSYPSFVSVVLCYRGHHYLEARCWPVNLVADACKRHTPKPAQETPEEEGARMFRENVSLSNVWGSCSPINFPEIGRVLDAYVIEAEKNAKAS